MFFGHISNVNDKQYPNAIKTALDYIKKTDFDKMQAGRYPIKDDLIYVQILDLETKDKLTILPEVHRKYIDVQYLHSGVESMGVAPDLGTNSIAQVYHPERDILFYEDAEYESELICRAGNFAVFFPEDIHRPGCAIGQPSKIRKVVVKIAVSEI